MPQDFDLNQFKTTYFEECQDLLISAEEYLGVLKRDLTNVDVEVLHGIFRCVHSIKGGGGAFNFVELVNFAHTLETTLDRLREGKLSISENLMDCLMRANDVLVTLVQAAQEERSVPASLWQGVASELEAFSLGNHIEKIIVPSDEANEVVDERNALLIKSLSGYSKTADEEEEQGWGLFLENIFPQDALDLPENEVEQTAEGQADQVSDDSENTPLYRIRFVPEPHLLQFANEPLLLARELNTLGKCRAKADLSRLPALNEIAPDVAYLSWVFELRTDKSIADIEEVFEFVVDDCLLEIAQIENSEIDNPQIDPASVDSALSFSDHNEEDVVADVPAAKNADTAPQKDVEVTVDPVISSGGGGEVTSKASSLPVSKPEETALAASVNNMDPAVSDIAFQKVSSIRVELERVDKLVNMVGELVITQAMLRQQADNLADGVGQIMVQGFEELSAYTRELQESVMAIRMQPVKSVFARMPRLVRELSGKLGKKADLVTSGEMTEVDKTVIEQLMDPLTHMIRNSVDHGIETPEERLKAGKPERATIRLNAEHRSGRIQIDVFDDGRGIDRQKVLRKAIEKGVIEATHTLEEDEVDNLIFAPGFSTAEEVSDVSGRGVGMDVVRRNVVSLGGRISVFSSPGVGTRFTMSLPLTLAVLDGMIVKCGPEKYIIPLTSIIESIHPLAEEVKNLMNGETLVNVRGEYIRIVNLYRLFNIKNAITDPVEALVVIVDTERYGPVGIMVDELLGQQQVVIKSLEENYDPIPGVSAATIMGDGKVALILDMDGLAEMEHGSEKRRKFGQVAQQIYLTGE